MAKKEKAVTNEDAPVEAGTEAAKGGRAIVLNVNGESIKRIDYIRQLWSEGLSRSEITKKVSEVQGEAVQYQIIFAATKGQPGGPKKEAASDEAAA